MSPAGRLVLLGVGAAYAIGLLLLLLFLVREILALVFIAWVVAAALRPPVDTLSRRLPRALAAAAVYLVVLLVFVNLGLLIIPPLVVQLIALAERLPEALASLEQGFGLLQAWLTEHGVELDLGESIRQGLQVLGQAAGPLISVPLAALGLVVAMVTMVVISFYWLLIRDRALDWLMSFLSSESEARWRRLFDQAEEQMGAYVRGLAILALAVGLLVFIGLTILGLPFALALAVLAGILELLPIIGPILSAIPSVIIAATVSPLLALATVGLYLVVQQVENYVLVPKVHEKAVGLSPLATLLAVLAGASLAGIIGALIAVPVAALINLLLEEWRRSRIETFKSRQRAVQQEQ